MKKHLKKNNATRIKTSILFIHLFIALLILLNVIKASNVTMLLPAVYLRFSRGRDFEIFEYYTRIL